MEEPENEWKNLNSYTIIKSRLISAKKDLPAKKNFLVTLRQDLEDLITEVDSQDDVQLIREFNSHESALNCCVVGNEHSNFRESDRQQMRYKVVENLCSLIFLRYSCGKFTNISTHVSVFVKEMTQLMEKDNEDINAMVFRWLCKLFSELPVMCCKEVSYLLDQFTLGYIYMRTDAERMIQSESINMDMWYKYKMESSDTSTKCTSIPNVITFLSKGLSSLRVWAKVPKFLSALINNNKQDQGITFLSLLTRELVSELMNFFMVDVCQAITDDPNISIEALEQYLLVQLQTFKLLYNLQERENFEMKVLISGFLTMVRNCPNHGVMLRLELLQTFDMLLHNSIGPSEFINIIAEVSEDLNQGNIEVAIRLFAPKVYDSYLDYKLQAQICGLLPKLLQRYIKLTGCILKITEMLQTIIDSYTLRIKTFAKVELTVLEGIASRVIPQCKIVFMLIKRLIFLHTEFHKFILLIILETYVRFSREDLIKATVTKDSPASIHSKKIIQLLDLPNGLIGTDCINLFQSIVFGTLSATKSISEYNNGMVFSSDYRNENDLIPAYAKFFKYFLTISGILHSDLQVNFQNNNLLLEQQKQIMVNSANIFSILPTFMARRIFYYRYNVCKNAAIKQPSKFSIFRNFTKTLLTSQTSSSKEFMSLLISYFFRTINSLEMDEKLKEQPDKRIAISFETRNICQVNESYLEDILLCAKDDSDLEESHTNCLMTILKKSMEMLEIETATIMRVFFLNVLILLFNNKAKFKSISSISPEELLLIINRLKKVYYESSNIIHVLNKMIELFLSIADDYPTEHKLIYLSALMEPIVKALKSTEHSSVLKALKILDGLEDLSDKCVIFYAFPYRKEVFEGLKNIQSFQNKDINEIALRVQVSFRKVLYDCQNQLECETPSAFSIKLKCRQLSTDSFDFAPMEKVLESALNSVYNDRVNFRDENRSHCMILAQGYLALNVHINVKNIYSSVKQLIQLKTFHKTKIRLCSNQPAREAHKAILTLMLTCTAKNLNFVHACLLHYILVALWEQVQHIKMAAKVDTEIMPSSNEIGPELMEIDDSDAESATEDPDENEATEDSDENEASEDSDENEMTEDSDENESTEDSDDNETTEDSDDNETTEDSDENETTEGSDENVTTEGSDESEGDWDTVTPPKPTKGYQMAAVDIKAMDAFIIVDAIVNFIASTGNAVEGVFAFRRILDYSYSILGSNMLAEFNLLRYYIKKMCYLCYEQNSSLQFSGCKMMEALLQDRHQILIISKEKMIDKKSFCSKVLTDDLLPKFVHALLHIIGSKEFSTTECFNSAKSNLENICSLFHVYTCIKKEPFNKILEIFLKNMFSKNRYIKEQVRLCLKNIALALEMNLFHIIKPQLVKTPEVQDYFYPSPSSKIDASKDLQFLPLIEFYFNPNDPMSPKRIFDVLKPYCRLISTDDDYLNSSADKKLLYNEAFTALSRLYFKMSEENRRFIIQVLNKNLKITEVSDLAFCCVRDIHRAWKEKSFEQRIGQIPHIFELFDKNLRQLKSVTLWHYYFIIMMFGDYFSIQLNFLIQFKTVFTLNCKQLFLNMNIIKVWELYDRMMDIFKDLFLDDFMPTTSLKPPSYQLAELLLFQIQNCETDLRMGYGNYIFNLAIPVLKYFPEISGKYFLYSEHNERAFAYYFDFILKSSKKVNFLGVVEKYAKETIFRDPEKYLDLDLTEQLDEVWLRRLKKFLNIIYCLCNDKEHGNFRDNFVKNEELVSSLRSIWNWEKFQFWYIAQQTKEFKNLQVYKQLAYCLLEVYKHIGTVEILFDIMKAPLEHFPEGFHFLTSFLQNNKKLSEQFFIIFSMCMIHTDPENKVPEVDLTKIPLTVSIRISKKISQLPYQKVYLDDCQFKMWRFILLPHFKKFCKNNICNEKLHELHYHFVKKLEYYKCDEISEDVTACLVKFSCLLLRHYSPFCNEKEKLSWLNFAQSVWLKFARSIADKDTYFSKPFCSAMKYYSYLLSCHLEFIINEDQKSVIPKITSLLTNTNTPEIIEESLLLIPNIFKCTKIPLNIIKDLFTSVIRASRFLYQFGMVPDTRQLVMDTVSRCQEFCMKKTGPKSHVRGLFLSLADDLATFLQEINATSTNSSEMPVSSPITVGQPLQSDQQLSLQSDQELEFILNRKNIPRKNCILDCIEEIIFGAKEIKFINSKSISSHALPSIALLEEEYAFNEFPFKSQSSLVQELVRKEGIFEEVLGQVDHMKFFNALFKHCHLHRSFAETLWSNLFPERFKHSLGLVKLPFVKSAYEDKVANDELLPVGWIVYAECLLRYYPPPYSSQFYDVVKCFMKIPNLSKLMCLQLEEMLFSKTDNAGQIIRESKNKNQLAEGYLEMKEDDLLYGFYKNYSTFPQTYVGFSYEKQGLFQKASKLYSEVKLQVDDFEAYALKTGYSRCAVEISKWSYLTETKFIVCKEILENDSNQNISCECQSNATNEGDEIGKIYFCLCPHQLINPIYYQQLSNKIQEIHDCLVNKMKTIPIMLSAEYIDVLQNAARVYELEKAQCNTKIILEATNEKDLECTTNYIKSLAKPIKHNNFFQQDICAARLRLFSLYFFKVAKLRLPTLLLLARRVFNKCLINLAAQSLKQGDPDSYLKYHSNLKYSPPAWHLIQLYIEMILFKQKDIHDPNSREEWLKKLKIPIDVLWDSVMELQVTPLLPRSMCKTYIGLLKSHIDPENAIKSFEESLNIEDEEKIISIEKNQDFYGIYLEKMFISAEPEKRKLDTALKSIKLLFNSCKHKSKDNAQASLARILGLLSYDGNSEMERNVAERAHEIPTDYWLPLLPQLVETISNYKDHMPVLLESIGKKYFQSVFFVFKKFRPGFAAFPKTFSAEFKKSISRLKNSNPLLFSTLMTIDQELLCLKRKFCDDTLVKLKAIEATICDLAFEFSVNWACTSRLKDYVPFQNRYKSVFVNRLAKEIDNIKSTCPYELEGNTDSTKEIPLNKMTNINKIWEVIFKHLKILSDIIKCHEKRVFQTKSLNKYCSKLSTLHFDKINVMMFDHHFIPKDDNSVQILGFSPRLEIIQKHNTYACRISIKGSDGKEHSYLIVPESCLSYNGHETKVTQLLSFLNIMLKQQREASSLLRFDLSVVISFPSLELIKDSKEVFSYFDIFKKYIMDAEQNLFVEYFKVFGKLNQYLDSSLRGRFFSVVEEIIPRTVFKNWAKVNYKSANDYWMFRKKFSNEVGLLNYTKYCFLLSYLSPYNLYINERTGEVTAFGLKFLERNMGTNIVENDELNWPPFQLTPNIQEFINPCGIEGSVAITMGMTAQCFLKYLPDIEPLLKLFLQNLSDFEEINSKMEEKQKEILEHVDKISTLIKDSADYGTYEKIHGLIRDSIKMENMSLMNPFVHPWL